MKAGSLAQVPQPIQQTQAVKAPAAAPSAPAPALEAFPFITSGAPVSSVTIDPYPVKQASTWYKATLPFRNAPGQSRRRDIRDRLTQHMQALGYTYEGGSIDSVLVAMFSHSAGSYGNWHSVDQASLDWSNAAQSLPKHLKGFMIFAEDFKVVRVPEAKGLWRARGETESRLNSAPVSPELPTLANGGVSRSSSSSRSSTPTSATRKSNTNGAHGRQSSTTSTRSTTNGANGVNGRNTSGAKPVTNGINTRKYDYPRAEETAIEAAKRRARAVLLAEGLSEFASGWQVGGR